VSQLCVVGTRTECSFQVERPRSDLSIVQHDALQRTRAGLQDGANGVLGQRRITLKKQRNRAGHDRSRHRGAFRDRVSLVDDEAFFIVRTATSGGKHAGAGSARVRGACHGAGNPDARGDDVRFDRAKRVRPARAEVGDGVERSVVGGSEVRHLDRRADGIDPIVAA
jgi:hypothetical protein